MARPVTEWTLVDIVVEAAADGFGHVRARMWAEDATLVALASQTLVLREAGPDGRSQRRNRRIVGDAEEPDG